MLICSPDGEHRIFWGISSESSDVGAIGGHDIDLIISVVAVRSERDLAAVGRPGRMEIVSGILGKSDLVVTIRVHNEYIGEIGITITLRGEQDL